MLVARVAHFPRCLDAIGKEVEQQSVISDHDLLSLRRDLLAVFAKAGAPLLERAEYPSDADDYTSCICGGLLHAWASAAGDPAAEVSSWMGRGAPAGIEANFCEIGNTLPIIEPDATLAPDSLETVLELSLIHI